VFDLLAVWGAVTGTIATLIVLLRYLGDRPKIELTVGSSVSRTAPAELRIDAANHRTTGDDAPRRRRNGRH
jgi:hypothetical protein